MSLTHEQRMKTTEEFAKNMRLLGVTSGNAAAALGSTSRYVEQVIGLHSKRIEDPWIVRNWLLSLARDRGVSLVPFTALSGDYRGYWFLDSDYIDHGQLD